MEHLLVDLALEPSEVERLVRPGDLISFAQAPVETSGDTIFGHTMDDRAAVAALTVCLEELKRRPHAWDLWAVATVQEEETLGGALTSAHQLRPSIAIAVDVTFGASPGTPGHKSFPLGEGPTFGWGPNSHPGLFQAFKDLAERLEIPYKTEPMPRYSGTDAMALQVANEGIPSFVMGIPLRYMHTPVEMVSTKDIQRAGRLLAEFVAQLSSNYLDSLHWEE
jgi:tetrahedral aminopeptidase